MKDDPSLKWLKPLISSTHKREQKKYCWFHKNHDHSTKECKDLKGQIKGLIKKEKLQKVMKKDHHHHLVEEKPN